MANDVTVTGIPETVHALEAVAKFDVEAASNEAARMVIPEVQRQTRADTGNLRSGWDVDDASFINTVEYAPMQEFGTVYVPATNALKQAWESESGLAEDAFAKEIDDAISKAGFDS